MTFKYIKQNDIRDENSSRPDFERQSNSVHVQRLAVNSCKNWKIPAVFGLHRAKCPAFLAFALFAVLVLPLLFASCKNGFTDNGPIVTPAQKAAQTGAQGTTTKNIPSDTEKKVLLSVCGVLQTEGALPPELANAMINAVNSLPVASSLNGAAADAQVFGAEQSRTAIPYLPELSTITYRIEVCDEDDELLTESDGVNYEITRTTTGASYSVSGLGYGTYTIVAKAYINDVKILESAEEEIVLNETSSVFMHDFDLRPTADGEGYINLDVNFDFDFNVTNYSCEAKIWTVSNDTTSSVSLTVSEGDTAQNIVLSQPNASGIASGSYPVTINFYKLGGSTGSSSSSSGSSSGSGNSSSTSGRVLMYTIDEVINVCDGLTTSVWTKNGDAPHLFQSENGNGYICKVTSSMMDQFVATNYFVDNDDGNDNNLGSYFDPFKTISHAIDYVNTTGGNKAYTIRVKGTFNETINLSANKTSGISSLTIKKSVQNGDAKIDGTGKNASVVTISTTKPLTFENLTIQNGSVDGNGAGVNIVDSENANNGAHVTFTGCTITGNTAGTANSSQLHGGGMWIGCYATVTLTDCVISENICQGDSDSSGGGMIVKTNATVTLTGCVISDNESVNAGGIMSTGELELTDCTIGNNTASIGGAMYIENEASFCGEMSIPAGIGQGHNDIYLCGSNTKIDIGDDFSLKGDPIRLDFESYIHNRVVFTGISSVLEAAAEQFTVTSGLFSLTTNGKLSLNPNIYVSAASGGSSGSTAGSDTTGDGTSAAPYATVTKALQRIKDLNTSLQFVIHVSGTINDAITLNSSTFGTNAPTSIKICGTNEANGILDGTDKNASIVSIKTAIPVTLEKLTIQNASTTESDGGGIYIEDNNGESTVTITDCNITDNTTGGNGGGIYITRSSNNPLNLTVTDCNITNNTASEGGGIWMQNEGGTVTIQNTTLSGNTAGQGAGIRVWRGAPAFTGCTFSNNNAENGGAVSVATSVTFDGDTSIAAGDGQGHNDIYLGDSGAKINIGDDFSLTGNNAMIRANSENNGIAENRVVLSGSGTIVNAASEKFYFDSLLYKINGSGKLAVITEWYVSSTSSTPAGSDTAGRGTEASPFETVTKVLDTIKDVLTGKDFIIHIKGTISDKITLAPSSSGAQPSSITICGTNMTTDGIQATVDFDPESIDPDDPESFGPEYLDALYAAISVVNNSLTNPVTLKNLKITADVGGFDPEDPESLNGYVSVYNNGHLILENYDETPSNEDLYGSLFLGGNENVYLGIKGKVMMNVSLPEGKLINITGALDNSSRIGVFVDEGNEPTAPTATSDGTVTVTSGLGANSGLSAADVGTVFYSADDETYAVRMNTATVTADTEVVVGLSGGSFSSETLSDRLYFTLNNAASGGNNVTSFYTGYAKDLYIMATRGSGANATVVSPSNLTYSILLKCGGNTTATLLSTTQTPTVQGNAVKVTIPTTVEYPDSYTVFVQATYSVNGVVYDASFPLEGKEWLGAGDPPPDGFVAVTGATVTGAVGSGDTASSVFIAGRTVEIPDVYVCDHEVTQAEYQAVIGTNPSNFTSNPANGETQANRPVEKVSWYNALVYCNKKSIAENLTPCYTINGSTNPAAWGTVPTSSNDTWNAATCNFNANGYRLPTEAEWEYIARGGNNGIPTTQTTYSGSGSVGDVAWYESNSGNKTHEVKKKTANSLGIYDMSGNVWELCWDWYGDITSSTAASGVSSGSDRVRRGGCWSGGDSFSSVAIRGYNTPDVTNGNDGFRVVRTVQ